MFGSLYYNFWLALIGFTVYFLARFQTNQAPLSIILFGFLWAAIAFIVTFILRGILGYIMYTPESEEDILESNDEQQSEQQAGATVGEMNSPLENQSEEIAQVVQTMLQQDKK